MTEKPEVEINGHRPRLEEWVFFMNSIGIRGKSILAVLLLFASSISTFAQGNGNGNKPSTPSAPVTSLPANAFTIPPTLASFNHYLGSNTVPDPSGTQYAISSVTMTNSLNYPVNVYIIAMALPIGITNCNVEGPSNFVFASGPQLLVPAKGTVQVTFPQPFVTAAVSPGVVCLEAKANDLDTSGTFPGFTWSVVGYKILP